MYFTYFFMNCIIRFWDKYSPPTSLKYIAEIEIDYESLSLNSNLSFDFVLQNIDKPWEIVMNNLDKKWKSFYLFKNPSFLCNEEDVINNKCPKLL